MLIAFALIVGLDIAIWLLRSALNIPTDNALDAMAKSSTGLSVAASMPAIGLDAVKVLAQALITAPVAVAIHRFILLGEIRRVDPLSRLTLHFAAWIFAFDILVSAFNWALRFLHAMSDGMQWGLIILLINFFIFIIRITLLYPGVAVGEASEGAYRRLDIAFRRSSGMFWLMIGSLVLTLLPAFALAMLAAFIVAFVNIALGLVSTSIVMQVWFNLFGIFAIALAAAVASYLYSYAAHRAADPDASHSLSP
ncbi:MAG TPA: hypothetical protein VJ750_03430 [Rhizomicrobium sp.]|nr:hypothetical protein [Rhizomicrobium sp.]